jgi:hypothetical protein
LGHDPQSQEDLGHVPRGSVDRAPAFIGVHLRLSFGGDSICPDIFVHLWFNIISGQAVLLDSRAFAARVRR